MGKLLLTLAWSNQVALEGCNAMMMMKLMTISTKKLKINVKNSSTENWKVFTYFY